MPSSEGPPPHAHPQKEHFAVGVPGAAAASAHDLTADEDEVEDAALHLPLAENLPPGDRPADRSAATNQAALVGIAEVQRTFGSRHSLQWALPDAAAPLAPPANNLGELSKTS